MMSEDWCRGRKNSKFSNLLIGKNKVVGWWNDVDMKTKVEQNEGDIKHVACNVLIRLVQQVIRFFVFKIILVTKYFTHATTI